MDIRNVTEFRNFVSLNQIANTHSSVTALVNCVQEYEQGCHCWKEKDRQIMYNNCKILYGQAVGVVGAGLRTIFLKHAPDGKLNFYQDGVLMASVHR